SADAAGDKCRVTGSGANQRVVEDPEGTGTLIEWNVGRIDAGTPRTLTFTAKIDEAAGGGESYTNRAHLVGYTLPDTLTPDPSDGPRRGDRATGAQAELRIAPAALTKSVTTVNGQGSAPVGETVRYEITTTLP